MQLTKEEILEIISKHSEQEITEETAKEQIYVCLNCSNSWEDKGFTFNKIGFNYSCNKCKEIVWSKQNRIF